MTNPLSNQQNWKLILNVIRRIVYILMSEYNKSLVVSGSVKCSCRRATAGVSVKASARRNLGNANKTAAVGIGCITQAWTGTLSETRERDCLFAL